MVECMIKYSKSEDGTWAAKHMCVYGFGPTKATARADLIKEITGSIASCERDIQGLKETLKEVLKCKLK